MTILSKLTTQELSCLFGIVVAMLAYLMGYYKGHMHLTYEERCRIDGTAREVIDREANEINWLRSLIDGDVDGDEDDE